MHKRIIAVFVAVFICCQTITFFATDVEKSQEKQSQLQEENKLIKKELEENQAKQNEKQQEQDRLILKLSEINTEINTNQENMLALEIEITNKENSIKQINENVLQKKEKLMERLKILYLAGETSNIEIILGAKDFSDFIDSLFLVQWISQHDYDLIDSLKEEVNKLEQEKQMLENAQISLEDEKSALNSNQSRYETLVQENKQALNALGQEEQIAADHLHENDEEINQIDEEIAAYYKAQKEAQEKKKQEQKKAETQEKPSYENDNAENSNNQNNSNNTSNGNSAGGSNSNSNDTNNNNSNTQNSGYLWPTPGFYHLTSLWEENRGSSNHGALDIANSGISGTKVLAAESGVVIAANNSCVHNWGKDMSYSCGCGGGYGNFVIIDHGNYKSTVYAHFSSTAVSAGSSVSKGQVIGYVGSTGHSTGAHLHFETRLNNIKYNPLSEYPGLNYTY